MIEVATKAAVYSTVVNSCTRLLSTTVVLTNILRNNATHAVSTMLATQAPQNPKDQNTTCRR